MRKSPISLAVATLAGCLAVAVGPGTARAQSELRLFGEPTSYTDVIDAFDEDDPFDLNVNIGYVRSQTSGDIQREQNRPEASDGRASANYVDIAEHSRLVNTLELGLDVGIYHDLALYGRLPIVLSDDRKLSSPDGRTATEVNADLLAVDGSHLFTVPFTSPTRSGIDHVELGLAWAIFNQHRDPEYPTLLIMAEGHFGMGETMNPCADEGGSTRCEGGSEAGISHGTHALRLETRASRRFRYIEPYAGLSFDIAFPAGAEKEFQPGGDLSGYMNTLPPRVGEMTIGMAVIPWEQRARWQRFVIDLRFRGAYISEGHGYSPLYDALGTSTNPYLTSSSNECGDPDYSPDCRQVQFTGLTDMQSHGRIGGQVAIEMQAARYVRFQLGGGIFYTSPYLATFTDSCNPNADPSDEELSLPVSRDPMDPGPVQSDSRIGTCRNGIINPHHRSAIDLPGQRFRVGGEVTFDFFASATAQF